MNGTRHHSTTPPWHALAHGASHDIGRMVDAAERAAAALQRGDAEPATWDALAHSLAQTQAFLQRLQGWALGDPGAPYAIQLADWLPAVAEDLTHLGAPSHTVSVTHSEVYGTVYLDGERYARAVHALVANAVEATPAGGAIRVHLEATSTQLHVTVADEGPGLALPAAAALRPYSTTKAGHKGLGLADVMALAQGYGGDLHLSSTLDGTTARLSVAVERAEVAEHEYIPEEQPARNAIVIVDDEPTLLRVATHMLERNGYVCHIASTADAALALIKRHHMAVGLAIVDYLLPDATGTELIHHIRQTHPGLPVILSSGISHSELHQHAAEAHVDGILSKPYRAGDLLYAVQAVLPAVPLAQATS